MEGGHITSASSRTRLLSWSLLFPLRGANSTPIDGVPLKRLLYGLFWERKIYLQ
jgi:hypothetical protein